MKYPTYFDYNAIREGRARVRRAIGNWLAAADVANWCFPALFMSAAELRTRRLQSFAVCMWGYYHDMVKRVQS